MGDLVRRVQDVLDQLVETGAELGLQAAVYRRGELLVDAVAGTADPDTGRPVTPGTLFYVASAAKAVTATVVNVLVEAGAFDYDTPIAELWPEFGAHGKHTATVRHALTHSMGVPAMPADTTLERMCDWAAMCAAIADERPWWTPGEQTGYHALTFGYVLGEVVRRASGAPVSRVLAERVAGPIGAGDELFLGVPASATARLARFVDDPGGVALFDELVRELGGDRFGPPGLRFDAAYANRADVLACDIPATGTVSARGLARMYAALLDDVDGVRLVPPARLELMTAVATTGSDTTIGGPASYGLGYAVGRIGLARAGASVFGAAGMGGSAAFADRADGVVVAVTKNRFDPTQLTAFTRVRHVVTRELARS